tara:strand:- start:1738 stop:3312 length:1575 start_codon:yes stop_codon:yes gene_type:complete
MAMRLEPKEIVKRADKADDRKEQWRTIYEECYEFALPQRNLFSGYYEGKTPGQNKMVGVFDATAINSTQRFANRIQQALFPPYRNWCRLVAGNDVPDERKDEIAGALDIYTEKMFDVIRQTNFDLAMSEFLLDLCVGTAVMLVQPGDDEVPVRFTSVPQYLVSLEEGPYSTIDNVYRKMRMRVDVIQRQWPDSKLPDVIQRMIENKPDEEVELLEATVWSNELNEYCYHVVFRQKREGSKAEEAHELVYRTMSVSPWIVARYMKVAGEVYGRGPLVTALPDIKTLNKVKELVLKNASIAVAGVYTAADDGVLNPQNITIAPGAIIPVARNGGPAGESLKPLRSAADFNVGQLVINDLVMGIKKMLLDDTLPMDTQSARTALEISARLSELSSQMGAAYGRLVTECMMPLVNRILYVMDEKNLIDMPFKVDGQVIKAVPISPLAQGQAMDELKNVLEFAQIAQAVGPAGQVAINQERMLDYIVDKMAVPRDIINTEQERQQVMAEMQQMMAMAQGQQPQEETPDG